MNDKLSIRITKLTFVMSLLVVMLHATISVVLPVNFRYAIVIEHCNLMISYGAVPLFFAISGYLFFYNQQRQVFKKVKRRLLNIVPQYILWNTLSMIFFILIYLFFSVDVFGFDGGVIDTIINGGLDPKK